ncbi:MULTISPECIES: 3'(2'),5'-bisphosphate nucleotidase CysQ [unclassified Caulobacter]|uniref:3'(2'),5'-bisphosphate nucleotidase CysQ n=1 Tax=unclassified Caulobacter TaxID=2648921 RepID=UPI000D3770D2|nr:MULTISPECIES: 3'(2'),5'-bisphosphate nucleotidase CysQ [unclassified Caulobacter]PTS91695.1 3'(2'),5'-bisphosphate nucleotidase [Caulobacter sp. HMWF009]PTT06732.1 3'(2'),5'-bisphosphate nucleotidase [Caulobacter sp. HMWF025]PTT82377.1 3'(2'),5'-bisphosphate nucleotidase [Pseudomonas sp. HMWF010]
MSVSDLPLAALPLADWGRALAAITEEAATVILPFWRTELDVSQKADSSPVTEADRAGERLILQRLAEQFPGVPTVSEEYASEFGAPEDIGPRFFLVDPVDGTKAFVRGDPNFTVNIGLIENGVPVAGAICAPATGEVWFTAAEGVLKRLSPEAPELPVTVRPWPTGQAVALVSHTMKEERAAELAAEYGFDLRTPMDSSIKMCRIAEGSADIYPRHGPTMEWDTAAGHAILVAAGGRFTMPDGGAFLYGKADQGFRNGWFVARGL